MKLKFFSSAAIAVAIVSLSLVYGQESKQTPGAPNASQVSNVDTQGISNYLLGPGDVLEVKIFGEPELSTNAAVDSEGNLSSLPFIEVPIPAKCRTEREVQKAITAAYSKLINDPHVTVRILERNSRQPATVFGAVRQARQVPMLRKVRLNELMAASGGLTERAAGTIQILHTEPVMCPALGEEADAAPIDGTNLPFRVIKISELKAGKRNANPLIRPGDYVLVTEAEEVYITGSVVAPGGVLLRDQLTLTKALAMVGGTRREAKLSDVRIYRHKPGSLVEERLRVDVAAIKRNQKPDVLLEPFDVIEVNEAGVMSKERFGDTVWQAVTGGFLNVFTSGGRMIGPR